MDVWWHVELEQVREAPEAHTQTPQSNCRTSYTNTHTVVRARRRSFTKHSPPSPGYHWHRFSLIRTHYPTISHIHGCQEAACCPCGLWRIITQQWRLKKPRVNFLSESSPSSQNKAIHNSRQLSGMFSWNCVSAQQEQFRKCCLNWAVKNQNKAI